MRKWAVLFVVFCLAMTCPALIYSSTWTVRQDASGDFTTIQDAVAAAAAYDTIEVGPGTYFGTNTITVPLTIRSSGGPGVTTVDGSGTENHFNFHDTFLSRLEGFTLVNGYNGSGGGSVRVQEGSVVLIHDCVFDGNYTDYHAGALFTRDAGTNVLVDNCIFKDNHSEHNGGAATSILDSKLAFYGCSFTGNYTGILGGALATNEAILDVHDCLIEGNTCGLEAGGIYYYRGEGSITGNTIIANISNQELSASVYIEQTELTEFSRNIVAGELVTWGLAFEDSPECPHTCNIFWDNAQGHILNGTVGPDEYIVDPLFCDSGNGDYSVSYLSKAVPEQNVCNELIGAFEAGCNLDPPVEVPEILTILDIEDDNGYQVRIRWNRCIHDAAGSSTAIVGYAIYRCSETSWDGAAPMSSPGGERTFEKGVALDGWDYIATIPSRGDSIYQYVAPTLCNYSKLNGICWTQFFVSAMTEDPYTYFDSEPASGYSVDNLPPAIPAGLVGEYLENEHEILLSWEINDEDDLDSYRIYSGSEEMFVPSIDNLLANTEDPEYCDDAYTSCEIYYKVSAVDINGNESAYALLLPVEITGDEGGTIPVADYLAQNYPNPFNPATRIEFGIREAGHVSLSVYDVAGRLVRVLADRSYDAGVHGIDWNGTDESGSVLASGIYIYRLSTGESVRTKKMILLR